MVFQIPWKNSPTVLNTLLIPSQAWENMPVNHDTTELNTPVMPLQIPWNQPTTVFHTLTMPSQALRNRLPNQDTTELNTPTMPSQIPLKKSTTLPQAALIFSQAARNAAFTLSQFFIRRTIMAIRATMARIIQVMGLAAMTALTMA